MKKLIISAIVVALVGAFGSKGGKDADAARVAPKTPSFQVPALDKGYGVALPEGVYGPAMATRVAAVGGGKPKAGAVKPAKSWVCGETYVNDIGGRNSNCYWR